MKFNNNNAIISYVSIAIIVISLFFIGVRFTGYAVTNNETGVVNVTIQTSAALNFTTDLLDFGAGTITPGSRALVWTNGTAVAWTPAVANPTGQLVLENIGNVNLSVTLQTNKTAVDFLGGTDPGFGAQVADDPNAIGSCTGNQTFASYAPINETAQLACQSLGYAPNQDTVDINFFINISDNAIGAKTVGIVAIGTY